MARSVATITTEIQTNIRTYSSLNAYKFPSEGGSPVSVFNSIINVVALSIYTLEVILDAWVTTINAIAASAVAGNAKWVQAQILKFQYGDTVTMVNYVPTYSPINIANRIVTQCAVKDLGNGTIQVKVAQGTSSPYLPLSTPQLNALKDYYYGTSSTPGVGFAGVKASFVTLNPDKLYISANIFFIGQYVGTTVQANVITAINNFLTTFNNTAFDGRIYMIKLVDAIQAVAGVNRVQLLSVQGRAQTVAFGSGTVVDIQGYYDTVAGHVISEDTGGQTLSTSLVMVQEV
jgi:hypothetical protein